MNKDEFRQAMSALPEPPSDSKPPLWDYWRHDLWRKATIGVDPEGLFGWPCIYHTMRVDHWPGAIQYEYEHLLDKYPDMLEACLMPLFGNPKDFFAEKYSANLIHQAYHLSILKHDTGADFRQMERIFEFGGGYGAMAQVVRRLGFTGEYRIFDLPEFCLLQQYYLSNNGIHDVEWIKDEETIFAVQHDLFIACFSLSETDANVRKFALEIFPSYRYLFLYNVRFEKYDNVDFFSDVINHRLEYLWTTTPCKHIADDIFYLTGKPLWHIDSTPIPTSVVK